MPAPKIIIFLLSIFSCSHLYPETNAIETTQHAIGGIVIGGAAVVLGVVGIFFTLCMLERLYYRTIPSYRNTLVYTLCKYNCYRLARHFDHKQLKTNTILAIIQEALEKNHPQIISELIGNIDDDRDILKIFKIVLKDSNNVDIISQCIQKLPTYRDGYINLFSQIIQKAKILNNYSILQTFIDRTDIHYYCTNLIFELLKRPMNSEIYKILCSINGINKESKFLLAMYGNNEK